MSKYFTHYDLHLSNVLLYDVGENNYIQMRYIYRDDSSITTILFTPFNISNADYL